VKREPRPRIVLALAVAVAVVAAAVGAAADGVAGCRLRSVDRASYVAENEAIFRRIPGFPGARLSNSYSTGETAIDTCLPIANGEPYGNFTTTHVYRTARPHRRGAIVRYYRKRLLARGWRWVARSGFDRLPLDSVFRRRAASLYVSEAHQGRGAWIVTVDHAAYAHVRR